MTDRKLLITVIIVLTILFLTITIVFSGKHMSNENCGFIMIRHVNNKTTNEYWKEAYRCIRKFYPTTQIVIIDDNSNPEYIDDMKLTNAIVIQSEYKGRGELLPYYYYAKMGKYWFKNAIILHDSVFVSQKIDLTLHNDAYKMLWIFKHDWDQPEDEVRLLSTLNHSHEILDFYKDKTKWVGCFGCMTIISHDYITSIDQKYGLSNLLPVITTRYNRCSFERVIACLLQYHYMEYNNGQPVYDNILYGDIHKYCRWEYTYHEYKKEGPNPFTPLVKVWTGR